MSAPLSPIALHKALSAIWDTPPGWGRLSAVNHTVIGRRFIIAAFIFFAIGGMLSMLIRAQLATSNSAFIGPEIYNQIFTMHGTIMMFLFAIPMFEGLAIYLLPKMLGARDMAFPRLSAYGFWCYIFGGSILIVALLAGAAPDGGWFMYTPLSSSTYTPGINSDVWLLGITFVEISAIGAAVEIVVTILKMRAPGMSLDRMPIFAWYMLVTAMMMLVGFPPLILGSILLEVERVFDWPFFDPVRGGDPLLWQHLFWLFGHPEVYIIFLPAAGLISTMIPVLARHPLTGYSWIVVSIIAMGFLSFGLWVHHMFTTGIPHLALGFFSAASMLVAIPTGVQIFSWIATLLAGRPQLKLPMLFLFGFFFVFVLGGLTGVMVAVVPFDWQAHDTYFVVAHLHYVLVGGFVFPMLAAAYYWLPHFTGRTTVYRLGYFSFALIFIGFNLTFFLMHLTGLRGMPRRISTYPAEHGWDMLNLLSSFGGFVLTMGFALFAMDVLLQSRFGPRSPRDPWKAETLEWATATPPPSYGIASLPRVSSREPLRADPDLPRRLAAGGGYLPFARNGWMETLGTSIVRADVQQLIVLPNNTFLPLWSALATGVVFLSLLFKQYWLTPLAAVAVLVLLLAWTRTGERRDHGLLDIGHGETAPHHAESGDAPSLWAMIFVLLADSTLFVSLVFSFLFLVVSAPGWPPSEMIASGEMPALATALALVAAGVAAARAAQIVRTDGRPVFWAALSGASSVMAVAGLAYLGYVSLPDPTAHAYSATSGALLAYAGFHAGLGAVFGGFCVYRMLTGFVSARRASDLRIAALWQMHAALVGAVSLIVLYVLPAALR
ncbi:cytochrome c oxidase subunit I [Terrihabitans rhizophilus]|uniref:cytochrome-c oxidase n=1 Tax=Terrihabitans rhizophilus TaxID=3092662 RepID=A0ABU4RM32_9HYPH|nr:cytochrome c oxidase subunit I [Terrihabitans sp. PJ23]MDX6805882.1 cytochrome c oxidase subunit I [Terrihabitans sp. PJ23]